MKWEDSDGFLELIKDKNRFGIFLDMGVGKTSLLLALLDYKFFNCNVKKVLVITPKVVSLATWQNQIDLWENFQYMKPIVKLIDGVEDERNEMLDHTSEFCIHIISSGLVEWMDGWYEIVTAKSGKKRKVFHPNKHLPKYDMIIIDECSQFRSPQSNRFRSLKRIMAPNLFLLSGTPFANATREETVNGDVYVQADELYYVFNLLGMFQQSLSDFRMRFCFTMPFDEYNYRMSVQVYDQLMADLEKYCIRKELQLDVKKKEYKVYCAMDQQRLKTLKKEYYVTTKNLTRITVPNKASMINKALQLSNGFVYNEKKEVMKINSNKMEKLLDLISVIDDNIIILYNFKEDREDIMRNIPGIREYTSKQDETDWNDGKIKYFLLSPFGDKYGLNLQQGGHTIIWYGLVWSAESYKQANARLYRRGQKFDVDIFYLMAEKSFDDYVYNKLISKISVIDDFISYVGI